MSPWGKETAVLILRTPTVYPPQGDTWLAADVLAGELCRPGMRVLDLCAGTGALAVAAARCGAGDVTAIDISRRAVAATWLNARCRGLDVRVLKGDLLTPVVDERFDLIVSNPPYVPALDERLPTGGAARAWDAGLDGRAVLDRICADAPPFLAPGGVLLLVFSAICGEDETVNRLRAAGLDSDVVARTAQPFGPVFNARARMLEDRGLIGVGQRFEELVVVRGRAPR